MKLTQRMCYSDGEVIKDTPQDIAKVNEISKKLRIVEGMYQFVFKVKYQQIKSANPNLKEDEVHKRTIDLIQKRKSS